MSPPAPDFIPTLDPKEEPDSLEFHSVTATETQLDLKFQRPLEELRRKGSTRGLDPVLETPEKKMARRGEDEQTKITFRGLEPRILAKTKGTPLLPSLNSAVGGETLGGFIGFANLPNQVHRKSVKKGFEFTLMVVGESGLGKSTLINSLFLTDLYPDRELPDAEAKIKQTVSMEASTVEIEERGVRLRLTVVDTPGFGDAINSSKCYDPILEYIDAQFERYLHDESGLNRRNISDNRVHCCFYFISPYGHGLKPLDIEFMKSLHNRVNIVPVIAKSDTLTKQEVNRLKKRVLDEIAKHNIKIYQLPDVEDDEEEDYKEQTRVLKQSIPFAVVGSTTTIEVKGRKVRGRMYPWGVVELENDEHCDYLKLRTMLISHMQDLQEVTHDLHYENYRATRLDPENVVEPVKPGKQASGNTDAKLREKEAELARMQAMLAQMQKQLQMQNDGQQTHQL